MAGGARGAIIRGTAIIRENTVLSAVAAAQPGNNFPCKQLYKKHTLHLIPKRVNATVGLMY